MLRCLVAPPTERIKVFWISMKQTMANSTGNMADNSDNMALYSRNLFTISTDIWTVNKFFASNDSKCQ